MLVKTCILVWIFAVFIESNAVTMGNGRKRVFKFRQKVTTIQTVSKFDTIQVSKPPISSKSASAVSCAALVMQYGPFRCMEYYDLQSTCRSFHQGETVNSLNSKLNAGWSFYNGEHLGNPYKECRMTVKGREYRGTKNITKTKKWCQRWGVNWPHKVYRPIYDKLGREEGSWIYTTNYCRNPDYEPGGPWCYTMDPHTRFEACGIPMCHCYT